MMIRPLMRQNIGELEALFEASTNDAKALKQLEQELKFRQVPRAVLLLEKVQKAASNLALAAIPKLGQVASPSRRPPRPHRLNAILFPDARAAPSHGEGTDQESGQRTDAGVSRGEGAAIDADSSQAPEQSLPVRQAETVMSLPDAYRALNVAPGSSWEVLEHARRQVVLQAHPERLQRLNDERKAEVRRSAQRANSAYATILRDLLNR